MFKRLILICIILFGINHVVYAVDNVTATVTAQDNFTGSIMPTGRGRSGYLNISISGTWVATVTLQRSYDSGVTWFDVTTYTANTENALIDREAPNLYQIGVKTGDFTSGSVVLRLSRERGN